MICEIANFVLYLSMGMINSVIIHFAFETKENNTKRIISILWLTLLSLLPISLKFVFNTNEVLRGLFLTSYILTELIFMARFLKGYLWQKLLFLSFQQILGAVAEGIVQIVMSEQLVQETEMSFALPISVIYCFFSTLIFIVMYVCFLFIWKSFFGKSGYDFKVFFIFSIFPVSQFTMVAVFNSKIYGEITQRTFFALVGILTAVIADAVLLYTLLRQQGMQEMQIRLGETQKAWEIEQNHYLNIEARREELAKIRHDLSEQFLVIQELMHREEFEKAEEMLDTLREYTASTREYIYCADPVVNAILAEQEKRCQEKDIRFEYELSIVRPLSLNPVAICSIFSNLLKNAVAAAEKAENRQAAFVLVKADVKGDYLHIKVENTYRKEKTGEKKKRRGYGIDILKNLTEKYKGQMEVTQTDERYSVQVLVENRENKEGNK